ncbi:hypothetical protein P4S72_23230, partial [Vibrio sp. PP-XX7]
LYPELIHSLDRFRIWHLSAILTASMIRCLLDYFAVIEYQTTTREQAMRELANHVDMESVRQIFGEIAKLKDGK